MFYHFNDRKMIHLRVVQNGLPEIMESLLNS